MNSSEIQAALDDVFDQGLLFHGYADYMRDYELFVSETADPRTGIPPRSLRYVFKCCVEAGVRTKLSAPTWRRSLDDVLTGREAGDKTEGYVWGVRWQELHPGGRVIEESDRARAWTDSIGIHFHEMVIESNAHVITLIASDLEIAEVEPGYAPFIVRDAESP